MKKVLFVVLVVVLTIGCKANQNKSDDNKLCDSIVGLIQQGTLHNDTAMLLKALNLSDSLLSIDTASFSRRLCYHNRAIILNSLGCKEEAMKNAEMEMNLLPEDNPQRLLFVAVKQLKEDEKDSADIYLEKVLSVCKLAQKQKFDENMVFYKIQALYLRYGDNIVKTYLLKLLNEHPNNQMLQYAKDNWGELKRNILESWR
jgi:hypothetical protein